MKPDGQELAVFDSNGSLRVSLELHSGKPADLLLYDDKFLPYAFDTATGKLVQFGAGANKWLQSVTGGYTRPVVLTDVRHQQLWKAP